MQASLAKLEDDLDAGESRLSELTTRLNEAEKQTDESLRARKELGNRCKNDDDRLNRLRAELDEYTDKNDELEEKCSAVSELLILLLFDMLDWFVLVINRFSTNVTLIYPLKTSERRRFSDVFRGIEVNIGRKWVKILQ